LKEKRRKRKLMLKAISQFASKPMLPPDLAYFTNLSNGVMMILEDFDGLL